MERITMLYRRMPIEIESPEEMGYATITYNLSESSIWDARLGDWTRGLEGLTLCYGEHRGSAGLRESVAGPHEGVGPDDVLVVPGAAAALFVVNSSLLDGHSSMLVVRPNYATNLETPRLLRCSIEYLELKFENRFELDLDEVASRIAAGTRLVSVTYPHNPTGVVLEEGKLRALIELVERHDCYLLVDETYRDLHRGPSPPLAAQLSDRAISVSSLSKAFGLPGIRMGWIICRNRELQDLFLAAKEQIFICNSVVDEEIARRVLVERDTLLLGIRARVGENYRVVSEWMANEQNLEWIPPQGGVVCLPRMKADLGVNTSAFYEALLQEFSTYVGPGHWFELSDRYFRLGYGWETKEKLAAGLRNISSALAEALE
jgi:aspartate/methionine/tyrosine aminotransferase